ncbi:PaaI family thioesterase [Syntrophomonas palmitatica]|uniref:PaaI family thioesterase n=1 Tax=Syntrophomonas palmitatica TaxID=402877 RepID=UPI0006D293A3|nr:PaaI family thioesterase [Syntrophomonas palmitatica]
MENLGIDPRLFDYINHSINETPFYSLLGIKVNKLGPGMAELDTIAESKHSNPLGAVHGGLYMCIADAAMGNAVRSLGIKGVTADCSTAFIAAASNGDRIVARGQVLKAGRNLVFVRAEVYAGEKLVADSKGTFYRTGIIEFK